MSLEKMISADALNKVVEANKEEQKKLKQVTLPAGFHIMLLKDVELRKSKKTDDPMFVITASKKDDPDEKHKSVSEYFVIQENGYKNKDGLNLNLYNFLSFFINAFKFVPKDIDPDDPLGDLASKVKKYIDKEFRGVISHEESLNKDQNAKYLSAKLTTNRCAHINDISITAENAPKYVKKLSAVHQAILDGKISPVAPGGKQKDNHGTPQITDEKTDDLPF